MEALDPFTVVAGGHICLTQANEIGQVKILPVSSHQWHTHTHAAALTQIKISNLFFQSKFIFKGKMCFSKAGKIPRFQTNIF